MPQKYPFLRFMNGLSMLAGLIVLIVAIVDRVRLGATTSLVLPGVDSTVANIILALALFTLGNLIDLLMTIEKNTRKE